jgi:hypothetical protein
MRASGPPATLRGAAPARRRARARAPPRAAAAASWRCPAATTRRWRDARGAVPPAAPRQRHGAAAPARSAQPAHKRARVVGAARGLPRSARGRRVAGNRRGPHPGAVRRGLLHALHRATEWLHGLQRGPRTRLDRERPLARKARTAPQRRPLRRRLLRRQGAQWCCARCPLPQQGRPQRRGPDRGPARRAPPAASPRGPTRVLAGPARLLVPGLGARPAPRPPAAPAPVAPAPPPLPLQLPLALAALPAPALAPAPPPARRSLRGARSERLRRCKRFKRRALLRPQGRRRPAPRGRQAGRWGRRRSGRLPLLRPKIGHERPKNPLLRRDRPRPLPAPLPAAPARALSLTSGLPPFRAPCAPRGPAAAPPRGDPRAPPRRAPRLCAPALLVGGGVRPLGALAPRAPRGCARLGVFRRLPQLRGGPGSCRLRPGSSGGARSRRCRARVYRSSGSSLAGRSRWRRAARRLARGARGGRELGEQRRRERGAASPQGPALSREPRLRAPRRTLGAGRRVGRPPCASVAGQLFCAQRPRVGRDPRQLLGPRGRGRVPCPTRTGGADARDALAAAQHQRARCGARGASAPGSGAQGPAGAAARGGGGGRGAHAAAAVLPPRLARARRPPSRRRRAPRGARRPGRGARAPAASRLRLLACFRPEGRPQATRARRAGFPRVAAPRRGAVAARRAAVLRARPRGRGRALARRTARAWAAMVRRTLPPCASAPAQATRQPCPGAAQEKPGGLEQVPAPAASNQQACAAARRCPRPAPRRSRAPAGSRAERPRCP